MKKIVYSFLFFLILISLTACGNNISGNYIGFDNKANAIGYIQLTDKNGDLSGTFKEFEVDANDSSKIDTKSFPISGQKNDFSFNFKVGNIISNVTMSGEIKSGNLLISDPNSTTIYTYKPSSQEQLKKSLQKLISK